MPESITDDQRDLVSEVREALAKATPFGLSGRKSTESYHLIANAPAWLEALCDENERLTARAEAAEAAVERVRRLATLALYKGPEPADTHAVVLDSLAKELLAALDGS